MDENNPINHVGAPTLPNQEPAEQPTETPSDTVNNQPEPTSAAAQAVNAAQPEAIAQSTTASQPTTGMNRPSPAPVMSTMSTNSAAKNQLSPSFKKGFLIYAIVCAILIVVSVAIGVISQLGSGTPMSTNESNNKPDSSSESNSDVSSFIPAAAVGSWKASSGDYWVFEKDGDFYWYKDYNDLSDNYYTGEAKKFLRGSNATNALGISQDKVDNLTQQSDGQVTINDIYYLELRPEILHTDGTTKTQEDTSTDTTFKILFVVTGSDSAQMVNFTTDSSTIYLKKVAD